ncbi:MAG: zinc ribbon domain-containing protein [Endomicrobia bacterium]|nr:zinc ribbon domain-containing protein [Endomicrobiia bacterium]
MKLVKIIKKIFLCFIIFGCFFSIEIFADVVCDRCATTNHNDNMFCENCGARLVKKNTKSSSQLNNDSSKSDNIIKENICTYCNTKNSPDAKFCQSCGKKLTFSSSREIQSTIKTNANNLSTDVIKILNKSKIYSILFPGTGQFYLGNKLDIKSEKIKGIILSGTSLLVLCSGVMLYIYAESLYGEFESTKDEILYEDYSTNIDVANLLFATVFGVWIYNVVDIYLTTSKIKQKGYVSFIFKPTSNMIRLNFSKKF